MTDLPPQLGLCPRHPGQWFNTGPKGGLCPVTDCDTELAVYLPPQPQEDVPLPVAEGLYRTAVEYRDRLTPVPALDQRLVAFLDWRRRRR